MRRQLKKEGGKKFSRWGFHALESLGMWGEGRTSIFISLFSGKKHVVCFFFFFDLKMLGRFFPFSENEEMEFRDKKFSLPTPPKLSSLSPFSPMIYRVKKVAAEKKWE